MAELTVNSIDLANYGVSLQNPERWQAAPAAIFDRIYVANRDGLIVQNVKRDAKLVEWPFLIDGATHTEVLSFLRSLNALFTRGASQKIPLTLVSGDRPAEYLRGHYVDFESRPRQAFGFITPNWAGSLRTLVADPPAWITTAQSSVGSITTSPVAIPQGSARPVDAVLAIFQPTNPTITLKDHNAATVGTPMAFGAFTPATNEYLVINFERRTIYRNLTGLPDDGTENSCDWSAGDFIEWDPAYWDFTSGGNPTLTISSGTGTMTYNKAHV
jgi:hypothetical protein